MSRSLVIVALTSAMVVMSALAGAAPAGETSYSPVPPASSMVTHSTVVQPGDHLWRISANHLAGALDRPPTNSEIAPYWRTTIEENRETLISGNPDLIFPGEVVVLPPGTIDSR